MGKINPIFLLTVFIENEINMRININSPSFISFLETITETITTSVNVENYFVLAQDKKMNVLYVVFKLMKNSTKNKANLTDDEFKSLINVLIKLNEKNENYEFAAILKDIFNNYESINEVTKPVRRIRKENKKDTI